MRTREVGVLASGALALFLAAFPHPVGAEPVSRATEPSVKAAFLFHFGSYVDWPESSFARADSPLTFGVLGESAVAEALAAVAAGRTIAGHPVRVLTVELGETPPELHVLFVGRSVGSRTAEALTSLSGRGTLRVTESDGALDLGSMVNFVLVDGKVRFDVALTAALEAELRLSSRLLAVARTVRSPPA